MTITSLCLTLIVAGYFSISNINESAPLFQSILVHLFFAFLQDMVYFIIIFRISEKRLGSWIAIIIASVIFGFKHLLFPGYTLWSAVAQTIEGGLLFSALFLHTRRIWILFGFYFTWNFVQHGIIGFPEFDKIPSLINLDIKGSDLITGNPVGMEASFVTFILLSGLGIYLLHKAYKQNKFIKPSWK